VLLLELLLLQVLRVLLLQMLRVLVLKISSLSAAR
jgi:hypothetical protein